jgi:hypothetical protein
MHGPIKHIKYMRFKPGDVIYPRWCFSLFSKRGSTYPYIFLITRVLAKQYECAVLVDECYEDIGTIISLEMAWTDQDYELYE